MKTLPERRSSKLVVQKLEKETLLYDLETNHAYCLNETSGLVWEACDGKTNTSRIAEIVEREMGMPISEEFVWLAIDQLNKEGLIEKGTEIFGRFAGLSRREIIRKVGFASMVALPMVSSLVAPNSAHAQSCQAPGTSFIVPTPVNSAGDCNIASRIVAAQVCCSAFSGNPSFDGGSGSCTAVCEQTPSPPPPGPVLVP